MEILESVGGKVIPVLNPWLALKYKRPNVGILNDDAFPPGSSIDYILSSEKTYQRSFPAQAGTLCWGAGNKYCFIFTLL